MFRRVPTAWCLVLLPTLALALLPSPVAEADEIIVVDLDSPMRYLALVEDPSLAADWVETDFDDSAWLEGTYGVGYDAGDMLRSTVAEGTLSVYTRTAFTVESLEAIESVHLGVDYDDGYVAWINGVEISRENMPDGVPDFDTAPLDDHESSNGDTPSFETIEDVTTTALPAFVEGVNVLAIGVWNDDAASSDLALVPRWSFNRPGPVVGTDLCGTLAEDVTLEAEESPYTVSCDVTVAEGATLRIEPGVQVLVADGVDIVVEGQIVAVGTEGTPISFQPNGGRWNELRIEPSGATAGLQSTLRHVHFSGGTDLVRIEHTGDATVLVENCAFDRWSHTAFEWNDAPRLTVRRCEFGLDTPEDERDVETVKGHGGGALVEYCTFGRKTGYNDVFDLYDTSWDEVVPVVRYNTFLGGEDDAIDYDECGGWIIGNLIVDFQPPPGATSGGNGGGITGQNSAPVILGNIVVNCFHGIGFKNDAQPLVVGNLVTGCHVGVTFYKDDCDEETPHATLYNNIVWNNRHRDTGEPQNLLLHGAWWPRYCQTIEGQATADVQYSIIEGGWPGTGNLDHDPLFAAPDERDFTLLPGSPAFDAGFGGPLAHPDATGEELVAAFVIDRDGRPRIDLPCVVDTGGGDVTFVDLGPFERQTCDGSGEGLFVRGDSNGDRTVDVSDAVHMLLVLFSGATAGACEDARDADDDGALAITDSVVVLEFLFRGGREIPAPYPNLGADPTADGLECPAGM